MSEVYLAGRGLASALGPDLATAVTTLRAGGVDPIDFDNGAGGTTPYFALPTTDEPWFARAIRLVRAAADESGALAGRDGALFIASTSFDMGVRAHGDAFDSSL